MDLLTMEERKMTAVEWLLESMLFPLPLNASGLAKVEQAKQMEKEQIVNAYRRGFISDDIKLADDYYNETYKNK